MMIWRVNGKPVFLSSRDLHALLILEGIEAPWLRSSTDAAVDQATRIIRDRISADVKNNASDAERFITRRETGSEAAKLAPEYIKAHGIVTGVTNCIEWAEEHPGDYPGEASGYVDNFTVTVYGRETWAQALRRVRFGKRWERKVLDLGNLDSRYDPVEKFILPKRQLLCAFEIARSAITALVGSVERFDLVTQSACFEFWPDKVLHRLKL